MAETLVWVAERSRGPANINRKIYTGIFDALQGYQVIAVQDAHDDNPMSVSSLGYDHFRTVDLRRASNKVVLAKLSPAKPDDLTPIWEPLHVGDYASLFCNKGDLWVPAALTKVMPWLKIRDKYTVNDLELILFSDKDRKSSRG